MFNGSKAESIDLTSFNTRNVSDMGNMFNSAEATTIIGLDTFNTGKVYTMAYMFNEVNVSSLDLSNFDTSNVTNMNLMFKGLENFNTSNVINMTGMFWGTKIDVLDLSSFDTSNVEGISYMFYNYYLLSLFVLHNQPLH